MVALGCSRVRAVSKFISVILADLAMVGFAISFLTLARVELPIAFSWFLCDMPQDDIEMKSMVSHFAQSETCRLERPTLLVPRAHGERARTHPDPLRARFERGKGAAEDCSVVNTRAPRGGVGSRMEK
jgi:hypothetical protein